MYGRFLHSVVVPGVGPSSGVEKVVRKDEARARRRHSHRPSSAERAVTLRKLLTYFCASEQRVCVTASYVYVVSVVL